MASDHMIPFSVSSHWEIADRLVEHLNSSGIDARVKKATAYEVTIPLAAFKKAQRFARKFDAESVIDELIARGVSR